MSSRSASASSADMNLFRRPVPSSRPLAISITLRSGPETGALTPLPSGQSPVRSSRLPPAVKALTLPAPAAPEPSLATVSWEVARWRGPLRLLSINVPGLGN